MSNKYTVKELCEFIWELEEKHKLFEWKESGIYIWPLLRFKLYYLLSEKIELFEKAHPFQSSGIEKIILLLKSIYLLAFKNPIKLAKNKEFFIVRHPRKVNGIDLYSHQLSEELKGRAFVSDTIDEAYSSKHVISLDAYKAWAYLLVYLTKPFVVFEKKHANLVIIEKEIEKKFDIAVDLKRLKHDQYMKFKILKKVYRTIFTLVKPKKLFIVGAYFRQELVAAARLENIPVIELQHGVITRYHLGYSYPNNDDIPYFPNDLWGFGEYWFKTTPLPKNVRTKVIGAPYIFDLSKKIDNEISNKNKIMFTSQGVIGPQLFDFSYEVAKGLPDYEIIFRLHPSENLNKYENLYKKKSKLSNFKVSHKSPNIFSLIASQEYQVGVFSTTLFEGFVLGAKTILVDLPGIEYMDSLIDSKEVLFVKTPAEFLEKFKNTSQVSSTDDYYAKAIEAFNL